MARRPFVGGNWKSNGTLDSSKKLAGELASSTWSFLKKVDVVICPIAHHVAPVNAAIRAGNSGPYRQQRPGGIKVGAQDVSATAEGAFTGEVSVGQLKDARIEWAIVGHSERRARNGETDELVASKLEKCQAAGVSAILCIGEQLAEREAGKTHEVNARMLTAAIPKVKNWKNVVIAYEPVWAIGTGKVATPEQAQEAHEAIRRVVSEKADAEIAKQVRIVYGGSVSPENCKDLITKPDIDGFLVGGASLKPTFADIVEACVPAVPLKKPNFKQVSDVAPELKGVNLFVKVVKAPEKVANSADLVEVVVGDSTGIVTMTVRGDRSKLCEVGKVLRVQNAHVEMFRGFIRVMVDKWAAMAEAADEDKAAPGDVKEDNNISEVEYMLSESK